MAELTAQAGNGKGAVATRTWTSPLTLRVIKGALNGAWSAISRAPMEYPRAAVTLNHSG